MEWFNRYCNTAQQSVHLTASGVGMRRPSGGKVILRNLVLFKSAAGEPNRWVVKTYDSVYLPFGKDQAWHSDQGTLSPSDSGAGSWPQPRRVYGADEARCVYPITGTDAAPPSDDVRSVGKRCRHRRFP